MVGRAPTQSEGCLRVSMSDNAGFICTVDDFTLSRIILTPAQRCFLVQATSWRETCTAGVLYFHKSHPFPMSSHRRTGCFQVLPATRGATRALLSNTVSH